MRGRAGQNVRAGPECRRWAWAWGPGNQFTDMVPGPGFRWILHPGSWIRSASCDATLRRYSSEVETSLGRRTRARSHWCRSDLTWSSATFGKLSAHGGSPLWSASSSTRTMGRKGHKLILLSRHLSIHEHVSDSWLLQVREDIRQLSYNQPTRADSQSERKSA